jgi:hypothetical protein
VNVCQTRYINIANIYVVKETKKKCFTVLLKKI